VKKLKTFSFILVALALVTGPTAVFAMGHAFPADISLPDGFQPEGIVSGYGTDFYVGSIPTGAIYKGDYRTGEGEVLVPPTEGKMAIGLSFDERTGFLFVSGGPTGAASVYDTQSSAQVGYVQLTTSAATFVNDVIVTRQAAYFTDSFQQVFYKVPLNKDGSLPDPLESEAISLGGDWEFVPGGFNANGIEATPQGDALIVVNSSLGALYKVDPSSGEAALIDLGGGSVPSGDGILLEGRDLYVVRNFPNRITIIELDPDLGAGEILTEITDPAAFKIPTTVASFGSRLYAVNARFDTAPTPETEYNVVQVSMP
jgi:sugar lactone lactonase YvrE